MQIDFLHLSIVFLAMLSCGSGCGKSNENSPSKEEDGEVKKDAAIEEDASLSHDVQRIDVIRYSDGGIEKVVLQDGGVEVTEAIKCKSRADCDDVACLSSGYCDLSGKWAPPNETGDVVFDASDSFNDLPFTPYEPFEDTSKPFVMWPLMQKYGTRENKQCFSDDDCVTVPINATDCCAPCDFDVSRDLYDIFTLKAEAARAYLDELCANVLCDEYCPSKDNWYLRPRCSNDLCTTVDLRSQRKWTYCTEHSQCRVRTYSCCECGGPMGPGQLLAVSDNEAYEAEVCAGTEQCPKCFPDYPDEVIALCSSTECVVADPRPW